MVGRAAPIATSRLTSVSGRAAFSSSSIKSPSAGAQSSPAMLAVPQLLAFGLRRHPKSGESLRCCDERSWKASELPLRAAERFHYSINYDESRTPAAIDIDTTFSCAQDRPAIADHLLASRGPSPIWANSVIEKCSHPRNSSVSRSSARRLLSAASVWFCSPQSPAVRGVPSPPFAANR
jgi:hypothetical protein